MRRKQLTPDDECRILHEAYQFLFRKYNLGETYEMLNPDAFKTDGDVPPSPGTYRVETKEWSPHHNITKWSKYCHTETNSAPNSFSDQNLIYPGQ